MEDICFYLRECIDYFIYDSEDYYLNRFYQALKFKDNKTLNDEFNCNDKLANGNYEFYRVLIILILTSDYYEYSKYNDANNEYLNFLDNPAITYMDVVSRFINDKKYALELMYSFSYYQKSMNNLLTTSCMDNILEHEELKKQIIKINPYVCLEYTKKCKLDDFEEEDIIKYYFCEVYENVENEICAKMFDEDEEYIYLATETENLTLSDYQNMKIAESFRIAIVNKLARFYNDDENKIKQALQFIIYDIFRRVITDSRIISQINEVSAITINYINNPSAIVDLFIFDLDFLTKMLNWYSYYTLCRIPDDTPRILLIDQVKTLRLLEKYNPFNKGDDKNDGN